MKLLLFAVLFCLYSCTMYVPKKVRAESIVRHYLDSVNKTDKVQVLTFSELLIFDSKYFNHENQIRFKADPWYNAKTTTEKISYRKLTEQVQQRLEGCEIFCIYRVKNNVHETLFKLDTMLTKIRSTVELPSNKRQVH